MTTIPAARPRQRFPEISAVSWEHPADRAARIAVIAILTAQIVIRRKWGDVIHYDLNTNEIDG